MEKTSWFFLRHERDFSAVTIPCVEEIKPSATLETKRPSTTTDSTIAQNCDPKQILRNDVEVILAFVCVRDENRHQSRALECGAGTSNAASTSTAKEQQALGYWLERA
jgi:hypothetical protein